MGYLLAIAAAFVPHQGAKRLIALGLVVLYLVYVRRSLAAGELIEGEDLDNLHLASILSEEQRPFPPIISRKVPVEEPPLWMVVTQLAVALGVIIGGAHLFVGEVQYFAGEFSIPAAVVALLLAPLATELPEKFNSVLWVSESKDTMALGNITGAMVFQGTLPATLGILFTSWNITVEWGTVGFLNALSAALALVGGGLVLVRVLDGDKGRLEPIPFLLGGVLYAVFIIVLLYHVLVLGVSAPAH